MDPTRRTPNYERCTIPSILQSWRSMRREESLREMIATDPHSPPQYRVNGVVRNIPEFYEAFEVAETDALYLPPEERVKIW